MKTAMAIAAVLLVGLAGCGSDHSPDLGDVTTPRQGTNPATASTPGGKAGAARTTTPGNAKTTLGQAAGAGASGGRAAARARFVSAADAICRDYNAHLATVVRSTGSINLSNPAARRRLAGSLDREYPALRADQLKIAALPRPRDRGLEDYVSVLYLRVALVPKLADALRAGNTRALTRLVARAGQLIQRSTRLARRYGFRECGRI
jgi:hypothetical protein